MKRKIGYAMMAAPLVALFTFCALDLGILQALAIFAITFSVAGWSLLAAHLVFSD